MKAKRSLTPSVLPVVLGTDLNAYGVAIQFYEAFGIKSRAIGKGRLIFTEKSSIIDVVTFPDFDKPDVFAEVMQAQGKRWRAEYDHLILLAANDNYAELAIEHQEILAPYFHLPFARKALMDQLILKAHFYGLCETHGLPYPKTVIVRQSDAPFELKLPFGFPVIAKPSNSTTYFTLDFEGKEKAFFVPDAARLREVLQLVYANGYDDAFIIQDYIPGDDTAGLVVNAYVNANSDVKMISIGQPILEDPTPIYIGNYAAIRDTQQPEVEAILSKFLKGIGYTGMANFDLKYDKRDGQYKVFELNLRQGRASGYTRLDGCNLAEALVDDFVLHNDVACVRSSGEPYLWLSVPPEVAVKFTEKEDVRAYAERMIKEHRYDVGYRYAKDKSMARRLVLAQYERMLRSRYDEYFVARGSR